MPDTLATEPTTPPGYVRTIEMARLTRVVPARSPVSVVEGVPA